MNTEQTIVKELNTDKKFNKWLETDGTTVQDLNAAFSAFMAAKLFDKANVIFAKMRAKIVENAAKKVTKK